MAHIIIKDRPCGWGKSTEIMAGYKPGQKYITVLPFLSEVKRTVQRASSQSNFKIVAPTNVAGTKRDNVEKLLREGASVACTHALFYRLGTLATQLVSTQLVGSIDDLDSLQIHKTCLLDEYHLIVDEVVDPFQTITDVSIREFQKDYVELGLASVEEDGLVVPTPDWEHRFYGGSRTFSPALFEAAKSGALYMLSDGLAVLTIPMELLLRPKTTTIYTYLSDGTILLAFLRRLEKKLADTPQAFTLAVDKLEPGPEAKWRKDVREALTVETISALERFNWAYGAQTTRFKGAKGQADCRSAGNALKKFAGSQLQCIDNVRIMLTCSRENWKAHVEGKKPVAGRIARHSRLFGHPFRLDGSEGNELCSTDWQTTGVHWVGNTTRGVNGYIKCTHAIYLYDQNPNPHLLRFLGMAPRSPEACKFSDAYALAELVQWVFRCCIRSGGINGTGETYRPRRKATVYIPSERMRNLLINWLATGEVCSLEKGAKPKPCTSRKKVLVQ